MRTLRFFGAPKPRQPTFSNLAPKKPSQIPLIQKPKKTLQNLNPQASKPKGLPPTTITTLKTPKPSTSNKNLKIDTKDNLILPTTYALSTSTHPHPSTSPIKLKKSFNPTVDNDKHYNPQQPSIKKVTKPISIQTFPITKVKSLHSYTNTASSTVNSEQNNTAGAFHTTTNNNMPKEGDYSSFRKADIFKNNVFLNKILLCINSLVNPKYSEKDLCKNPELLQKLIALESKNNLIEEQMKLQQLNKDVNIINAEMIQSSNQIAFESEQRKEIYQNYFNFYFDICKDIETLAQQLEKQNCCVSGNDNRNVNANGVRNYDANTDLNHNHNNNNKHINELKKIEEVNSKLSSLHSVINFSKTESQVLPCSNNNNNNNHLHNGINQNNFRSPTIPISPGSIHSTFNFNVNNSSKSINTQTLLISSLGSEFYQKIAEESFKNEINNFFSIHEEDHNHVSSNNNDNDDNNVSIDSAATIKGEFHPSTTKTKINILNGHNRSKTDIGVSNKNAANTNNVIKRTNHSCNSSNSSDIIYNDDSDSTIIDRDESNDTYYRIPTQIPVINPGIHLSITPLKKETNVKAATQTTPSPPKLISPNQNDNNNCMVF